MNNINCTQVQSTNDASTVSKCSAVKKNYFKDDFIEEFLYKKRTRTSLIHLGYYTRAVILNNLIVKFIEFLKVQELFKFQIISCGSGFDTTYWRLSQASFLNNDTFFIELDFPAVIQRKLFLIRKSKKLKSYTSEVEEMQRGMWKLNCNYFLIEADLSDLTLVQKVFKDLGVDYDIPTLFLSECVITYMNDYDSGELIKWMATNFRHCAFINYEQIHPDDGFGEVMLKHFDKLKSPLLSVTKYPDCKSHCSRYRDQGFENSFAISEWDALFWLTTEEERRKTFSLELFDEFEEFHLKCAHYVVAVAGNKVSSDWINSFSYKCPPNDFQMSCREYFKLDQLKSSLDLFRHSSCSAKDEIYLFGGCNKERRSSKVYKIIQKNCLSIEAIDKTDDPDVDLQMVYGTVTFFILNKLPLVCIYGGRTSPNKISNNGSLIVFELMDSQLLCRLIITKGNPIPRYRTAMVSLNPFRSEAQCWIFGGRTTVSNQTLSDLWQLNLKLEGGKNFTYTWKEHKRKNDNWPCSRMSHSFLACPKRHELFISGGFNAESSSVLNDIWKWSCESESWEQIRLAGRLLPRYGHTSHLKDDTIYLVGGVNTLAGMQPGLATIDLKTRAVVEYAMPPSVGDPVLLFNHTSELFDDGGDVRICVFGGGGNCFSFGTYLNQNVHCINPNQPRQV